MVCQKAILDLALQFENACTAKNDLRKAYEKCNDIPQESRALINTFLKEGSPKDYKLNLFMYGKTAKIEKQMNAKLLHQLHLDEEALRETLEEETMDEKEREEKIRQKQDDDEEFFMEFGVVKYDSEYETSYPTIQMDSNFTNENDPWEYSLDIDDSDIHLTPVVRSSSSARVEPSSSTPNPVRIIPGPAGTVQLSSNTCFEPSSSTPNPDGALMSTQEYMQKVVEDVGEDDDFNSGAWISATNYVISTGGTFLITGVIYNILNKENKNPFQASNPSHPPGFTPIVADANVEMDADNATISDNFVAVRVHYFRRFNELDRARRFVRISTLQSNAFNHFISSSGLIDLPLEGYLYTWAIKSAKKMSKLDRFLISEGLLLVFPSLFAICLERHLSDHRPIIMRENAVDYGLSPFRIYHSWFNKKGFDELVKISWNSTSFEDSSKITLLKKKFQSLKGSIKSWCKEDKQRSNNSRSSIQKRLSAIDKLFDSDKAQKAKVRWAVEGDENSKFFHGIVNMKRSQLAIRGVLIDGDWIDEPSNVKNEFLSHFANRFASPSGPSIVVDNSTFKQLSNEQVVDLECDITYDEIKRAVWDCGTNKSPGPDGFTFDFIRTYWNTINEDIVNAVREFFTTSSERQGDRLSPYLFILVMESLHLSFNNILNAGLFKGIRIDDTLTLSHLFYADDAIFIAPLGVLHDMESLRRKFFNGIEKNERKISLIGWNKILASKQKGGLGVSITSLYGNRLPIDGNVSGSVSAPWHCIIKELGSLSYKGINLLAQLKKKVGNGVHTLFWKDSWINGTPLKIIFPRVYALENRKDITVAEKLNDADLYAKDRWIWLLDSTGEFSVHSARIYIDSIMVTDLVPYKMVKVNQFESISSLVLHRLLAENCSLVEQ
ncbi:RNA-directed DNA polymerase, eukaryota [Tanacetum coccineum]